MKRPSFQFYPGDWQRDAGLRACSIGARGLWIEMICLMHDGSPYGYLKVGDMVIHPDNLARMVGATLDEVDGWLIELERAQVFSRSDDGTIFSRRMVRDEELRAKRAAAGSKGGNPALTKKSKDNEVVNQMDNHLVNHASNQNLTPASASASASASAFKDTPLPPEGVCASDGNDHPRKPRRADKPLEPLAGFEAFWQIYPRKDAKKAAIRTWNKIAPDRQLLEIILAAIRRQAVTEDWMKEDGRFVPYAATWLNGERWNDELPSDQPPPSAPPAVETDPEKIWDGGMTVAARRRMADMRAGKI